MATALRGSGASAGPRVSTRSRPNPFIIGDALMFGLRKKLAAAKALRQHRETMKAFDARVANARAKHQPIRHIEAERQDYMHSLLRRHADA